MSSPSIPSAPLLARTRFQASCRFSRVRAARSSPAPHSPRHEAGGALHRRPGQKRLHRSLLRKALLAQASDALRPASSRSANAPPRSVLRSRPRRSLLRPRLTSRAGSTPSPFQAQGEISLGKNALLHRTTAGSTPLPIGHKSFAVHCPLALVGRAFYPVLVHQPGASLHASSPHSVALIQSRLASFAMTSSRWDSHPQECAHAGRRKERPPRDGLSQMEMSCDQAIEAALRDVR
jgi:hypothetical protein